MELKINSLSKTYSNNVQALKNINLNISTGMFGLLGPNGAGKSTLMRTISTLQEADSGTIFLDNLDMLTEKQEVRKILGYLPQDFGLDPKVTAEEMLTHFAILKGISNSRERKTIVASLLNQTNLYESRTKKLGSFSGGMRQRFGIAQALLGNPKLLIVDEPTAGLDPAERIRFHNLLSEIGENIIIILSTHIVDDVSDLCSKMAIINKGEVLYTGEPANAINALQGKVWKKLICKTDIPTYQENYNILSTRLFTGKTLIHVFNNEQPDLSFDSVAVDLEDVYFFNIKKPVIA